MPPLKRIPPEAELTKTYPTPSLLAASFKNWIRTLGWQHWLAIAFAAAVVTIATYSSRPARARFDSLQAAKAKLDAVGFHCSSDQSIGGIGSGFCISRASVTVEEVASLCKVGRMGESWRGKVWVTLSPDCWQLQTIPEDAETRVWGSVVAFGDGEFLNEIDDLLATMAE